MYDPMCMGFQPAFPPPGPGEPMPIMVKAGDLVEEELNHF